MLLTDSADFSTTKQAREEASRRIGQLLWEHSGKLWVDQEWQMDVTDDAGLILFVVTVTAAKSPATSDFSVE